MPTNAAKIFVAEAIGTFTGAAMNAARTFGSVIASGQRGEAVATN